MRLNLSDTLKFEVTSFQEFLELLEDKVHMRLNVNVTYDQPLENLMAEFDELNIPTFEITELGTECKRTYTNFIFESINQNVNNFREIETSLMFVKTLGNN